MDPICDDRQVHHFPTSSERHWQELIANTQGAKNAHVEPTWSTLNGTRKINVRSTASRIARKWIAKERLYRCKPSVNTKPARTTRTKRAFGARSRSAVRTQVRLLRRRPRTMRVPIADIRSKPRGKRKRYARPNSTRNVSGVHLNHSVSEKQRESKSDRLFSRRVDSAISICRVRAPYPPVRQQGLRTIASIGDASCGTSSYYGGSLV